MRQNPQVQHRVIDLFLLDVVCIFPVKPLEIKPQKEDTRDL